MKTRVLLLLVATAAWLPALASAQSPQSIQSPAGPPGVQQSTTTNIPPTVDYTRETIRFWSPEAQNATRLMVEQWGSPDLTSGQMLQWNGRGPYERIIIFHRSWAHSFPSPHQDFIFHEVSMKVPLERVPEIMRFNGSILVDRTRGMVGVHCDSPAHNIMSLNLAYEIAQGKRTAASARRFYADAIAREQAGKTSRYLNGIVFQPTTNNEDPDRPSPRP